MTYDWDGHPQGHNCSKCGAWVSHGALHQCIQFSVPEPNLDAEILATLKEIRSLLKDVKLILLEAEDADQLRGG